MKIADFVIQTILIAMALVCLIAGITIEEWMFIFLGIVQFLIGIYQLISATISLFFKKERTLSLFIYWGLVVIYFSSSILVQHIDFSEEEYQYYDSTAQYFMKSLIWLAWAWLIAIYYYIITIIRAFKKSEKQTYLDIAN